MKKEELERKEKKLEGDINTLLLWAIGSIIVAVILVFVPVTGAFHLMVKALTILAVLFMGLAKPLRYVIELWHVRWALKNF